MCNHDADARLGGIDRRSFLRTSAMTFAAFALPWGSRAAHAAPAGGAGLPVLVAIYMRGAADGLNLVVPVRDRARYEQLRPTIALKDKDLLTLTPQFSLNKALQPLHPLYNRGELAVLHAVGSPHPTRSHFEAQDYMERAAPGSTSGPGWLNQSLVPIGGAGALRGVGLGKRPLALTGDEDTFATPSLDAAAGPDPRRRAALAAMFAQTAGVYPRTGASAFAAADVVKTVDRTTTVAYPGGPFGTGLKDAAALIKADLGARVICVDVGGWDHHNDLVNRMAGVGAGFAAALAAFWEDLGPAWRAKTCALTMTEFGRTAAENGSFGTDHGHGSVMFALGGGLNGGRVIADWPGLAAAQLNEGRDLKVTTDFRDVFAEVLNKHMKVNLGDMTPIFPGRAPKAADFPGLF